MEDQRRLKLLGQMARGHLLDVGCHDLQNPYLSSCVGFDIREPEGTLPNYTRFVCGDCEELDSYFMPSEFDTIIAGELIEHLENPSAFLKACHVILRDDGRLLLTTPNPYHWTAMAGNLLFCRNGLQRDHINLFPFRAMLALLMHCGFDLEKVRGASGARLWHTNRTHFIPCPRAFSWQLLYVCKKSGSPFRP